MKHNDIFEAIAEKDSYSLTDAVRRIQNKSLIKSIADIAARAFDNVLNKLPKPIKKFERMTEKFVIKSLDIAIVSTQKRGLREDFGNLRVFYRRQWVVSTACSGPQVCPLSCP